MGPLGDCLTLCQVPPRPYRAVRFCFSLLSQIMFVDDGQINHSSRLRMNAPPWCLASFSNLSVNASRVLPITGNPMAKQQVAKSEPQKAPYVTPKILTLKVDLSFASSATNFEDLIDSVNYPERPVPGTTETLSKSKSAAVRGKPLSPNP